MPRAACAQVAVFILLEVPGVDHDGLGEFLLLALLHRNHEALAVRRPGVIANISPDTDELTSLAAAAVEQHDLTLVRICGRYDKCEIAPIGAPPWLCGTFGCTSERQTLPAVPAHHPDRASLLIG